MTTDSSKTKNRCSGLRPNLGGYVLDDDTRSFSSGYRKPCNMTLGVEAGFDRLKAEGNYVETPLSSTKTKEQQKKLLIEYFDGVRDDYKGIAKSRAKEHLPQGHTKEDRIKVVSAWERQPCTNANAWQDKYADFDTASANMTDDQKICFRKLQSEFDVFLVHGMRHWADRDACAAAVRYFESRHTLPRRGRVAGWADFVSHVIRSDQIDCVALHNIIIALATKR